MGSSSSWNPLRVLCLVGAGAAAGLAFVFPPASPLALKAATWLSGLALGTAIRTPGHVPAGDR